ncbi:hypothetical protein PPL_05671 [Heterostelium album PN500]|uniref:UBC core domain-containing protein n=1 Tax=Heterostelium pallidum (strain ATCC 26659 / Pp 5 / PN500) TaxID=670386 RepID=D3BAU0_HETP5|nr:hypothetical protein PPL_05671 [Heterostelium album PN500]EFA81677.1 hypothetical protein PPL_05671 [Heterostelium album PN500]|eukprot:XP_020433794.1 hypothetical protein PPL_05671 [Heterostelium album PN500]
MNQQSSYTSSPMLYYYSPSNLCSNSIPPSPPSTPLSIVQHYSGNNSDMVYLEGPKDTFYEGGVFQLLLTFPKDYPMSPPSLRFLSEFWHPNVYQKEGKVCISILHPPGEDALSGELPQERWLPTQTVSTIILSVMSILSDPNCSSPANVDASVEWRQNRDAYKKRCAKLVEKANASKPAHIVIPHPDTNPEEHKRSVEKIKMAERGMDIDYFEMDEDDYNNYDEDDDDDDEDDENVDEDGDDDDDEDGVDDDEEEDDDNDNNANESTNVNTTNNNSSSNNNNNSSINNESNQNTTITNNARTNIIIQQDNENTTPPCIESYNLSPTVSTSPSSIENSIVSENNNNSNTEQSTTTTTTTTTTSTLNNNNLNNNNELNENNIILS